DAPAEAPWIPSADAGPLGFIPSNFTAPSIDAGLGGDAGAWNDAQDLHLATACADSANFSCFDSLGVSGVTIAMNDVNDTLADVYFLKSLTIAATASLTLRGPRPIILAVVDTVDIQGQLLVYAGGFQSLGATGPGAGQAVSGIGGGGSYCGVGGTSS